VAVDRSRVMFLGQWILIAVLSLAMVLLYADNKDTRECLSGYIKRDAAATIARAAANEKVQRTDDELWSSFMAVSTTPTEAAKKRALAALQQRITLSQELDKARKDNPYPPFPEGC